MRQKIDLYRRISRLQDVQAVADMRQELLDRFGELPQAADRLLELAELKMDAALWSVRVIGIEEHCLSFTYTDARRIQQLAERHRGKLRVIDSQHAFWPLWDSSPASAPSDAERSKRFAKLDLLAILRKILRYEG